MVKGFEGFKTWFQNYEKQYTIIGGTACDILMAKEGLDFRATKDIDLVLIVEAMTTDFGRRFWTYIQDGDYSHCHKSTGVPQFYRFSHPKSDEYPAMIELFSRKVDIMDLPDDAVLTPLPIDETISSLSAILLDDDYYSFLLEGRMNVDGITLLKPEYLIPFKAKAWLDLSERKSKGEHVDSKDIRKHRNDVFRLTNLIYPEEQIPAPETVCHDMNRFIGSMHSEQVDLKQLGIEGRTKEEIMEELLSMYVI